MLYVVDKIAKLGGIYLGGQVTSIEIQENANIYTDQDDKGRIKKMQPCGYEQGVVRIEIILEDTKYESTIVQLRKIQRLFKAHGQDNVKLLKIVNEDCAARGITQVYFKSITSKKEISESKRVVSLELWSPKIAGIKINKIASTEEKRTKKTKNKKKNKSPAKDTCSTIEGKRKAYLLTK